MAKKRSDCVLCKCAESCDVILNQFLVCLECKQVSTLNPKYIEMKVPFGLGNKSLDDAIIRLMEIKSQIPDKATARVIKGWNDSYHVKYSRPETQAELRDRMIRDIKQDEADKLRKARDLEDKKRREEKAKIAAEKKQKELEAHNAKQEQLKKEKANLEKFLNKHGIRFESLKEIITSGV